MRQPSLLRRYILFFCGVLCAALGIALITLAGMGTSAVSSLSYLSLGAICGLREGTIVCALTVGGISRFLCRRLSFLQYPSRSHPPIPAEASGAHTAAEP